MAANFLGLFFLIIGTTGISNVFSFKELFHKNKRSYPIWPDDSFNLRNFKGQSDALCRYKFGPFACRNIVYDPPYFRLKADPDKNNYPKWQNPYFKNGFARSHPFEDPFYDVVYDPYDPSEESISDHSFERHVNSEEKVSDYIRTSSGNPTQSNVYSKSNTHVTNSDGVNFETVIHSKLPDLTFLKESNEYSRIIETTSNPKISQIIHIIPVERQQKSSTSPKKENIDLIEDKNMLTTSENSSEGSTMESSVNNKDLNSITKFLINISTKKETTDSSFISKRESKIDGLVFPKSDPVTLYPTTPEIKRQSGWEFSLKESSSLFQDPSSFATREDTTMDDKIILSDDIHLTRDKGSKLEPTAFQSSSSVTTDEENSLKTKSSSSERIYTASTQNLDTESDTSLSSFTMTHDSTASHFKSSSSFETQSTTAEILEIERTTETSISPNKVTSIPFRDKVTEDSRKGTFSTESPSLKFRFTPEAITQEHIIEISSIRTARIVVTTIFLVIALTALTVLAVYMFRLRRREVQYDQLMLIT